MKKIFALILTLVLAFAACGAFAAELKPLPDVSMEDDLNNRTLRVGFKPDAVTEQGLVADIYAEQRYDAVEVSQLAVGDTVTYLGEETVVETIEEDYSTLINGGSLDADGITLCPDEGGTYIALEGESAAYLFLGCAEFPFADEVTYSHWQQDDEGGIMEEMAVQTVPAAQIQELLIAEGSDSFWPDSLTIRVEDGKIVELNVNYVP